MEVIPAIDLREGRCVRLYQGDYAREEVFGVDPVAIALRWQSEGAKLLHVVDLDGAASGSPKNVDAIRAIASSVEIVLEAGGGIRDMEKAVLLSDAGADRLVLGTSAVEDPGLVTQMLERFGVDSVVVSVDANSAGSPASLKSTNETPFTTRPASTSRQGMIRLVSIAHSTHALVTPSERSHGHGSYLRRRTR